MGGGGNIGEESDNPVAINVTAMVDVIFCLCIFFMCSFHFKQLEGKIESWLPKDLGVNPALSQANLFEDIRVIARWDAGNATTIRRVGTRPPVSSDAELIEIIKSMAKVFYDAGKKDFPILIQADRDVPWADVVHIMDLCKQNKMERIEFSSG